MVPVKILQDFQMQSGNFSLICIAVLIFSYAGYEKMLEKLLF